MQSDWCPYKKKFEHTHTHICTHAQREDYVSRQEKRSHLQDKERPQQKPNLLAL